MKKISMLQIPNSIVRNINLDSIDFSILSYFKFLSYVNKNNNFEIEIKKIKETTGIKDNRTIKKSFINLLDNEIIKTIPIFGRKNITNIKFNSDLFAEQTKYTQLPTNLLLNKLKDIGVNEFRLLYILESFILRKNSKKKTANPSIKELCRLMNSCPNSVLKNLKNLETQKIIVIEKNKTTSTQNEEGIYKFHRLCNNYHIEIDKLY